MKSIRGNDASSDRKSQGQTACMILLYVYAKCSGRFWTGKSLTARPCLFSLV